MTRLLSLAAGVMIEHRPEVVVSAAAAAGWPACGIWFDAETWSPSRERDIKQRLDDTGVVALDIEPIIVGPGPDPTDAIVAAAETLGTRFILFTSRSDDWALVIERYGRACDLAAPSGIIVVCEFLPIFPLATLADAARVVTAAGRPNSGVLIDNLHLRSSGAVPAAVSAYDVSLFPYIQIADAPLLAPDNLLDEALNGRSWPGDGGLPISELLLLVPDVPISFEVRSKPLRDGWPDAFERASYSWSKVGRYNISS